MWWRFQWPHDGSPLHPSAEFKQLLSLGDAEHSDNGPLQSTSSWGRLLEVKWGHRGQKFSPSQRHWPVWCQRRWRWGLPADCRGPGSVSLCSTGTNEGCHKLWDSLVLTGELIHAVSVYEKVLEMQKFIKVVHKIHSFHWTKYIFCYIICIHQTNLTAKLHLSTVHLWCIRLFSRLLVTDFLPSMNTVFCQLLWLSQRSHQVVCIVDRDLANGGAAGVHQKGITVVDGEGTETCKRVWRIISSCNSHYYLSALQKTIQTRGVKHRTHGPKVAQWRVTSGPYAQYHLITAWWW